MTDHYRIQHLFRVEPGIPHCYALEQASVMLDSVRRLTEVSAVDNDGSLVWAAHYLSAMAKALIDEVELGLQRSPV